MRLLICIDDTDSKTSEKGTGAIADDIRKMISSEFDAPCSYVSRHQLLLHPDVPYTSHNSSMCFETELPEERYEELLEKAQQIVAGESAPESDPGLAVADLAKVDRDLAIAFGKECKRKLMTKTDAYGAAARAGFFLIELGGTGDGVIGAAAGIGLRLWGFDGTMKGRPKDLEPGETYTLGELPKSRFIDRVLDLEGNPVPEDGQLVLPEKTKVAVYGGILTLLVEPEEGRPGYWQDPHRERMKHYGDVQVFKEGCADFVPDVEEEQTGEGGCYDCRYRRWTEKGIFCQRPEEQK
ncbi:MAG: hypothetical protein J6T17_08705 [Clostridia bacterium]|nr:hypothetical protein [Clostridia bacterium]